MTRKLKTNLLSIEAAAARLGVSHWTVRAWLRRSVLTAYKVGRRSLIAEEQLESLIRKPVNDPATLRARVEIETHIC
jgi:excisionase family DNA binding protein